MWQKFTVHDVRVIGHYLGVLILFFSILLLIPLITGLVFEEWKPASHYLITIGVTLIIGTLLRFLSVSPKRLDRQQALAVTGLSWIVLALIASIPLYLSGHFGSYLDALFEGVSGLTTTGATIIEDLDHLSYADNMWRFLMHFAGGLGLIVVAVSFGLFGRRIDSSLYSSEGRSEHVVPNIIHTTRTIAKIALIVIIIATVCITALCAMHGMEPVRALLQGFWMAVSAFMTGGFAPMSDSIMYYHSFPIEAVVMVLMVLGSISFTLHSEIWKGRVKDFFRDIEIRTLLVWLSVITLVFAASMSASVTFNDVPTLLRRGLFMVVSSFSTTGFQNITSDQLTSALTSGAFLVLAMVMAVGGSAGSTSGGFKLRRLGIIAKSIQVTVKEALAPDSARVGVDFYHLGRHRVTPEITREAMTVTTLFMVTYAIGSLVGIAHGYEATQAIYESVAMTSNGGISSGLAVAGMPASLEAVYIFQMWAGRLEFVTLLALIVEVVVSISPHNLIRARLR